MSRRTNPNGSGLLAWGLAAMALSVCPVQASDSFSCVRGEVRIAALEGPETSQPHEEDFCFQLGENRWISRDCLTEGGIPNGDCAALKLEMTSREDARPQGTGTPGSRLCLQLGGETQFVEYDVPGKKNPSKVHSFRVDRCYFSKDQSSISNAYLLKRHREK